MARCLTCQHWLPHETPKAHEKNKPWPEMGFARCKHDKPWTVHSLADSCSRHQPCSEATAVKREEWARKFRAVERCATD
jgi:hypothetical protein